MYVDDKEVSTSDFQVVHTVNRSTICQVIAVEVSNVFAYIAMMLESTFGVVSDKTWRCVSRTINEDNSWKLTTFNDSRWPFAHELRKNQNRLFGRNTKRIGDLFFAFKPQIF